MLSRFFVDYQKKTTHTKNQCKENSSTLFLKVLSTQFQCVCVAGSTYPRSFLTSAVCPTIQLNSNTIYSETALDSTG